MVQQSKPSLTLGSEDEVSESLAVNLAAIACPSSPNKFVAGRGRFREPFMGSLFAVLLNTRVPSKRSSLD